MLESQLQLQCVCWCECCIVQRSDFMINISGFREVISDKTCRTPAVGGLIWCVSESVCPKTCRHIDHIHAAAMMNKKRGLAGRFTANLRVST